MPLFPLPAPVTIVLDGRPLAAYVGAHVVAGHVYAPVSPLLTRLANRVWFLGNMLVIERGASRVRVRIASEAMAPLNGEVVAVAPILRAIGATVRYEAASHRLIVGTPPRAPVATPSPFHAEAPAVAPRAVFTPAETPTPRPRWTGSPLPRRTALPLSPPSVVLLRRDRDRPNRGRKRFAIALQRRR